MSASDIPDLVIPESMSPAEIIRGIVRYLDAQGHTFDEVVASDDPGAAPVKQRAVWAMRDRVASGAWIGTKETSM